ncbi:hypothetical protein THRCLA_07195 [Thraustotheca clavata]|uniref:Uncharacterized protein n=1 Tax=Thraustotheca clavata TaxID=74557 RepID=A0A1V9ZFN3_9STRA|nr:hypothetical protein THRCLA_07195 [Thraustotheca clavata]
MHKWLGIVHSDSEDDNSDSDHDLFDAQDNAQKHLNAKAYADNIAARTWGLSHRDRVGLTSGELKLTTESTVRFQEQLGQQRRVWDCALVLSRFLTNEMYFSKDYFVNKRVIELGCGIGVPGLSCALLGANQVVLTDMEVAIPWIEKNIEYNKVETIVRAQALMWGSPTGLGSFDVILCSDLIYGDEELSTALMKTIEDLSHAKTQVISAYEARFAGNQGSHFLENMKKTYTIDMVPYENLDSTYRSTNIHVQILRPL